MDWQDTLIGLYLDISNRFTRELLPHAMRLSNNRAPRFTDEEVLTIYLFGVLRGFRRLSAVHAYTRAHLASFFPRLPGYGAFVQRLNRLAGALPYLAGSLSHELCHRCAHDRERLVDSMPVTIAAGVRSSFSRAARPLADKGHTGSKGYFYGVKLHVVAFRRRGRLPLTEWVQMAPASANDLTVLKRFAYRMGSGELFADKIYRDRPWHEEMRARSGLEVITPVKRAKGQQMLHLTERAYSSAVSRARQAIESLFAWLDERTGIAKASQVRSTQGLMVHVFGRLAAALYLMNTNS